MQGGRMRQYAQLQTPTVSTNAAGEPALTFTTSQNVWCGITALSARDLLAGRGEGVEVSHKILMRYQATVAASQRIVCDGKTYEIKHVLDRSGRRRELELLATVMA